MYGFFYKMNTFSSHVTDHVDIKHKFNYHDVMLVSLSNSGLVQKMIITKKNS